MSRATRTDQGSILSNPFINTPNEINDLILSFLDLSSIIAFSRANKSCYNIAAFLLNGIRWNNMSELLLQISSSVVTIEEYKTLNNFLFTPTIHQHHWYLEAMKSHPTGLSSQGIDCTHIETFINQHFKETVLNLSVIKIEDSIMLLRVNSFDADILLSRNHETGHFDIRNMLEETSLERCEVIKALETAFQNYHNASMHNKIPVNTPANDIVGMSHWPKPYFSSSKMDRSAATIDNPAWGTEASTSGSTSGRSSTSPTLRNSDSD